MLIINFKIKKERERKEEGRRERGRVKDVRCALHAKSPHVRRVESAKERRVSLFSQEPRIISDWKLNRGASVSRKPNRRGSFPRRDRPPRRRALVCVT